MPLDPEVFRAVAEHTVVVRQPRQSLATFGTTTITYYLVTEPAYRDLVAESAATASETVVRRGTVTAERPQIVTPYYLLNLFRGFAHGEAFAQLMRDVYGAQTPGLMYAYHNELVETSIVSDSMPVVAQRLADQLEERGEGLAAVITGVDYLWDVSLAKFIFELTMRSLGQNVADFEQKGMFGHDRGLPRAARLRIDEMFLSMSRGELGPADLKAELDRWGVFPEYEDRFLNCFRR